MQKWLVASLIALLTSALMVPAQGTSKNTGAKGGGVRQQYVVLYRAGESLGAARAAIKKAGGTIVRENTKIGLATVTATRADFARGVAAQDALYGAARNRPIGYSNPRLRRKPDDVERSNAGVRGNRADAVRESDRRRAEPLAELQWDMAMINATAEGSHEEQKGRRGVTVGIIDTGVDGSHRDIAPNFNARRSRNFTVDVPLVDGECADDPDGSCEDPADTDENGHGTHVAGTIGSPINRLGIAGVAPRVTLVNLRAGQDSGFFFLQPSVDALTYAGDNGVDVVNMSYFIDPLLYNCPDNPADSPAEQLEQRTIVAATQRALRYARRHGVTLVSALGNSNTDIGNPTFDDISPDFPPDTEREREVDNGCLTMPTEGRGVVGVSALGPSERKSFYSNWGVEQTDVSAPGGDSFDAALPDPQHRVLAPYPQAALEEEELLDENGMPLSNRVIRDCRGNVCAYYRYLQGTSMASPHAAGVVALIVSEFGHRDDQSGGLTLRPSTVERILRRSARDHACPPGRVQEYPEIGEGFEAFTARCEGSRRFNGFYGHGIVDALGAVEFR